MQARHAARGIGEPIRSRGTCACAASPRARTSRRSSASSRRACARCRPKPWPLLDCIGRVLAEDVRSEVDVPAFARAAMDGFAVRGADSFGASDYDPVPLRVIGEALPGRPFVGAVARGRGGAHHDRRAAARGRRRRGAGGGLRGGGRARSRVREAVPPLRHVGARGEDIRAGETVLRAGRRLRPQDAGLLASIGATSAVCHRRPRVALLMTGDELLPAGQPRRGRAHRGQQLAGAARPRRARRRA